MNVKVAFWFLCFLSVVFMPPHTHAQDLLPPVVNYSSNDYGAASQNWGVSSDSLGVVYVANNEGLLTFDGQRWQKYKLPNETIVRSVFAHTGRIYTGSYEEFGYWEYDAFGDLEYTSLSALIPDGFDNEEFWGITVYKGDILFRSFGKVYRYDGQHIQAYKPDFLVTALLAKEDRLLVGAKNGRVYSLKNAIFTPIADAALPENQAVNSLADFNGQLIIGTRVGGLFTLREKKYIPWGTQQLNTFLTKNELNKIEVYESDQLVFGTVKGGLITYASRSKETGTFQLVNGLQNNTVLALHTEGNRLWAGLDNGVGAIDLGAPVTYYRDRTGELGAVYDIAFKEGKTYLGSNTGVHVLDGKVRRFVPGSQGQVWGFSSIEGHLYINHNRGVFELKNGRFLPISERTGSYALIPVPGSEGLYLNATYNGIARYRVLGGELVFDKIIDKTPTPIKQLLFDNKTELWAAHPYKGFFKLDLTTDPMAVKNIKKFGTDTLFKAYKTTVHQLPGAITAFYNAGNWLKYNGIKGRVEHFKEMAPYHNYTLINAGEGGYWFKNNEGPGYMYSDFRQDSLRVYDPLLEQRLVKGNVKAIKRSDSSYYITLNEGFAAINLSKIRKRVTGLDIQKPRLVAMGDLNGKIALGAKKPALTYRAAGRLNFRVAASAVADVSFDYKLLPGGAGSLNNGALVLRNLSPGDYKLSIVPRVNDRTGERPLVLRFSVLPPWYFSWPMLVAYALLVFITVYIIYHINRRKLNKHRREVELKVSKEQEHKMEAAERKALKQEIETKRKELANSTFQAAQRNRTLTDMKEQLGALGMSSENKSELKNIEGKITQMLDGKNHWEVFETNFNEINDSFFQDLLKDHPKLSAKDLKLCAYLKMNLTTKEIAPLMAISPRGVEIHRYRLRKKLRLKTATNLTKFLIERY